MSIFQLASFPKCTLHDDFDKLLKSGQFCDVDFLVGENGKATCIPAHIAIVAARSDWLRAKIREEKKITLNSSESCKKDKLIKLEVSLHELWYPAKMRNNFIFLIYKLGHSINFIRIEQFFVGTFT